MPGISSRSGRVMLVALCDHFPRLVTMIVVITGVSDGSGAGVVGNRDRAEFLRFRGSLLVNVLLHAMSDPTRSCLQWCDCRAASFEQIVANPIVDGTLLLKSPIVVSRSCEFLVVRPYRPGESVIGKVAMIVDRVFDGGDGGR